MSDAQGPFFISNWHHDDFKKLVRRRSGCTSVEVRDWLFTNAYYNRLAKEKVVEQGDLVNRHRLDKSHD